VKAERRDMETSLPKKGFERRESGHHIFFHHKYQGKVTGICTKISHTPKLREISGSLLTSIRMQLKLARSQEVADLFECPMDGHEYNRLLIERGILKSPK